MQRPRIHVSSAVHTLEAYQEAQQEGFTTGSSPIVEDRKEFAAKDRTMRSSKGVRCRFFFSATGCGRGASCEFSHALSTLPSFASSTTPSASSSSVMEIKQKTRPICKYFASGYCQNGYKCQFRHERIPHNKRLDGANQLSSKPRSLLTDAEVQQLRSSEIQTLKRKYPRRLDVDQSTFRFVFRMSDPDWVYDVKTLNLSLTLAGFYPRDTLTIDIYDADMLPKETAGFIVSRMNEWIADRHEINRKNDKVELMFKPFLKWLDKQAESLLTEGLSKYKQKMLAKAAGLTFVPNTKPNPSFVERSVAAPVASIPLKKASDEELTERMQAAKLDSDDSKSEGGSDSEKSGEKNSKAEAKKKTVVRLNPARRGTELRLRELVLKHNAATLYLPLIRIGVKCSRCKTVHHVNIQNEKPYVIVCDKCRGKMSLVFHANLMHMSSNTAGYFDLDACQPFDLLLPDCHAVSSCLDCSQDVPLHGLQPEQERQFWCLNHSCNKKMIVGLQKASFIVINEGAALKVGADAVIIAKKAKDKHELKTMGDGKPLPDNGACAHYKKSFRWFRFPCCNKLYPCDKCHDEREMDHEMDMANRMVCGFCSHEQGFSLTKPCVRCDSSMTRARSQHWEGGKGCRNKISMSKTDKQKYAGSNKTVSHKAEESQKKSGAKTTRVRHTS